MTVFLIMLLISLLMVPDEVPDATMNLTMPQLRQDFIWVLKPDGTYHVSDAFTVRDTSPGRIREDRIGPHENMPEYEDALSSGGLYCYTTPYFYQKDRRWTRILYGDYTFGRTGCVPTALAMIFSGVRGEEILPTEIGDYLYYDCARFNSPQSGGYGVSSDAVIMAAKKYGISYRVLRSYEEFAAALQEGKCVYLAVNYMYGVTHAYVCLGWNNGLTYVKDSDSPALNHYYDTRLLWQSRSTNTYDSRAGSPAIALWGN